MKGDFKLPETALQWFIFCNIEAVFDDVRTLAQRGYKNQDQ